MALDFSLSALTFTNERVVIGGSKANRATDGSVGAPIIVSFTVTVTGGDLQGKTMRFNPALFMPSGVLGRVPVTAYYYCRFPAVLVGGELVDMPVYTDGTANEENQRNLTCRAAVIDTTHCYIQLSMRLTMDVGNYILTSEQSNERRFKRTTPAAPVEWDNTVASVYFKTNREFRGWVYLTDGTDEPVHSIEGTYQARWYDQGLGTGLTVPPAAEFSPGFSCVLLRGGVEVDNFSQMSRTTVKMRWLKDDADRILDSDALVYVIEETAEPNAGTYLDDYASQGVNVATTAGTGNIGENIYAPAQAFTTEVEGPDTYHVLTFDVGIDLDPNKLYAVIVVLSGHKVAAADDTFTNSFQRHGIPADGVGTPVEMGDDAFDGSILDYNLEPYSDNVVSTVVDNLVCRVKVDTNAYVDGVSEKEDAGEFFASTWQNDLKRIRIVITDEDTSEELWTSEYTKSGGVWSGPNGIIKPTYTKPTETDLGSGIIQYDIDFRNCFENPDGLPNFAGRNIIHEWRFCMEYLDAAWTVEYSYKQRVHVQPFGAFLKVIQKIELFDYESGLPLQTLCDGDKVLVKVTLDAAQAGDDVWNIRVYWQTSGRGYSADPFEKRDRRAPETEAYVSPSGFLQLADPKVTGLPETFTGNEALFVFDHADLPVGAQVRLYAIAEPVQGPCDAYPCLPNIDEIVFTPITADQQATIEAGPPAPGDLYLIIDLPDATPLVSPTLWEQNTGNAVFWNGSGWTVVALDAGRILKIDSGTVLADEGTRYWIVCEPVTGTTLYPSGKFCLPWLYRPRRLNGSLTGDGSGPGQFMFYSQNTGIRRNAVGLSKCRFGRVQVDSPSPPETWITIFTISELDAYSAIPPTAVNINYRVQWFVDETECGGLQGTSSQRNFPP